MAKAMHVSKMLNDSAVREARGDSDTIRVWESYREQAIMWRALCLLQIPATFVAVFMAFWMWKTRSVTLNVPAKPLPGLYSVDEIPDAEYIENATEFINLIATYQPAVAKKQFEKARELVQEPLLGYYDTNFMGTELKAIETTSRTQTFFIDPTKTEIKREGDHQVFVSMTGDRMKIVAGKQLPSVTTKFTVTLSTIPNNQLNPYGIVVTNLQFENIQN